MDNFNWSKSEKAVARNAFNEAYQRECRTIAAKLKEMAASIKEPADIWRIHDYLSEERKRTDFKYDYRYSVLISVFANLFNEGWLQESDLAGLQEDKIERIKMLAKLRREMFD
jgi:hypothetical protein